MRDCSHTCNAGQKHAVTMSRSQPLYDLLVLDTDHVRHCFPCHLSRGMPGVGILTTETRRAWQSRLSIADSASTLRICMRLIFANGVSDRPRVAARSLAAIDSHTPRFKMHRSCMPHRLRATAAVRADCVSAHSIQNKALARREQQHLRFFFSSSFFSFLFFSFLSFSFLPYRLVYSFLVLPPSCFLAPAVKGRSVPFSSVCVG